MRLFTKPFTCLLFLIACSYNSFSQKDSTHLRISVITCAPGDELYSAFGHSALRIVDSVQHTNIVYNWGTFDFSDPDFYMKFTRGKLLYFLSPEEYNSFIQEYIEEQRPVFEQVINCSPAEKNAIYETVMLNMMPNNRAYHYDFLYDNCTTRIKDLLKKHLHGFQLHAQLVKPGTTYRHLLYEYLDKGGQPWSKLGIDILLGSKIDKTIGSDEAMFLPFYCLAGLDSATSAEGKVVLEKRPLVAAISNFQKAGIYDPLIYFSIVSLLIFGISFIKKSWAIRTVRIIDSFLFYLTGALGIFLLFMWFGTDHAATVNNYNLLWAFPFHFIAAFFVWKKPSWLRKYFYGIAILNAIILVFWIWLPQQLNIALIPFIALLGYRGFRLAKEEN